MEGKDPDLQHIILLYLVFLASVPFGSTQTQVCAYYENQTDVELQVVVYLNSGAVSGSGLNTTVSNDDVNYVSFEMNLSSNQAPDISMQRRVQMIDSSSRLPIIQLTTGLKYLSGSGNLSNIVFEEDISPGLQAYWTATFIPGYSDPDIIVTKRHRVKYSPAADLGSGNNYTLQYQAEPADNQGVDLATGVTHFYSYLSFNDTANSTQFGPFRLAVCLDTVRKYRTSIFYQHGFTALAFFIALLIGFLLVVLAVFLFLLIRRHHKGPSVTPSEYDENLMKEKGKKIVLDPKAALRKGDEIIKDCSIIGWNDSIVRILSLKDKLHMFREIDNLDVFATIQIDRDLEKEQNDATIQTSFLLIQGLRRNGDINQQTEEYAVGNFNKALKEIDKKLDAEYKKKLEMVFTDLSAKNKENLFELMQRHQQQKHQTTAMTKNVSERELDDLLKLMEQEQQMETNELTFGLALEQNEMVEKLRKEFAVQRQMGIKELQQSMMSEVISQGQLKTEQAEWLLKELRKQQEAVHRMFDEEISRQRMVLEEKLARRRALAQASEIQEDDNTEILNFMATHIMGYIQKARKISSLTRKKSDEWIEEMKAKALVVRTEMEAVKETQEKELHKALSQTKVAQFNDLIKKQNGEIQDFMKTNQAKQTEGPVDPVSYIESLLNLKSQHRVEVASLENQLDADHARQLAAVRVRALDQTQHKLLEMARETAQRVQAVGLPAKTVTGLTKKYNEEKESLHRAQDDSRQNHEDRLKEELSRKQREGSHQWKMECQEQKELREYQTNVVEKLISGQVFISDTERDKIMKEHEKQMVLLENSLTLNKLRQQRALEECLREKRAQQMNELYTKQQTEVTKLQKSAENNGGEDDEDTHRAVLQLLVKHAQQRIVIMQGDKLSINDELEQIHAQMTRERAEAVKCQEEYLSAMVTTLQMAKARELTQLELQQKAFNCFKANLMDDLLERGILSVPECERILENHRQELVTLNRRLEIQRTKQEKSVRTKLQDRQQQREYLILAQHEAEMKNLMQTSSNKFATKVRQIVLVHKHMVETEKFRNRIARETAQSLAETRREFELTKLRKLQEEELEFVAGLVRVGSFENDELLDVLHMLFPSKMQEEVQQLLGCITRGLQQSANQDRIENGQHSKIVERIYQAQYANTTILNFSGSARSIGRKKQQKSRLGSKFSLLGTDDGTITLNPLQGDLAQDVQDTSFSSENYKSNRAGNSSELSVYYSHPNSNGKFSDNNYHPNNKNPGVNLTALEADMFHGDMELVPVDRLPPLQTGDQPKRLKKKRHGFLKKHKNVTA